MAAALTYNEKKMQDDALAWSFLAESKKRWEDSLKKAENAKAIELRYPGSSVDDHRKIIEAHEYILKTYGPSKSEA